MRDSFVSSLLLIVGARALSLSLLCVCVCVPVPLHWKHSTGLLLDKDLWYGSSEYCSTFENEPLVPEYMLIRNDYDNLVFKCTHVEVFGLF